MKRELNIEKVTELYKQGLTECTVAEKLGCSVVTVRHYLKRADFPRRKQSDYRTPINLDLLKHLYLDEKLSTREIARRLNLSRTPIMTRLREMGCLRTSKEGIRLAIGKGGRITTSKGYIRILQPNHPRANHHRYVLEHILVWEEHHKQPLPEGWHIHHLNGIKTDNRPSNLIALPPTKHREKYTTLLQERAKKIRELEIENRQLKYALENSQMILYVNEN